MSELVEFRYNPDLDPWEQQDNEPNEYHAAFLQYADLPRRIDAKTGEPLSRNLTQLEKHTPWGIRHLRRLAHQYQWTERAAARDISAENDLAGQLADARAKMLSKRIDLLEELSGITLTVLRDQDPTTWKIRDAIELLKVQLVAQDNLLGLALQRQGQYGNEIGVDIRLPMGSTTAAIESRIEDIWTEIEQRHATNE